MDITQAFLDFKAEVDVPKGADDEARARRDIFRTAFASEAERIFPSGSLARGSQIDPINDVDMVAVFRASDHPDWGLPGESAEAALAAIRARVTALLGANGTHDQVVRQANLRNHSVKCFLDDPDDPGAFTVDLVPALEYEGHLLIPERKTKQWIESDPEYLIQSVAGRHADWPRFVHLVRMIKRWNKDHGATMKSLTVEVLALEHLSEAPIPQALSSFFTAAAARIYDPIEDPAGLCGPIQRDLDCKAALDALDAAASSAWHAVNAQNDGDTDRAACLWREVFGDAFPEPEGGCPDPSSPGPGLMIGTGVGVAPKKIIDAPQG